MLTGLAWFAAAWPTILGVAAQKPTAIMKRFSTFLLGTMVALSMAASPIDLRTSKASLDDDINVVAHNLVEDVYFGYPYVWASDGDYEVYAFLVTDPSSPFGSYDSENCMIT